MKKIMKSRFILCFFAMLLAVYSYGCDNSNSEHGKEKKDTTKKAAAADSLKAKEVTIDIDLIVDRMEQISPSIGAQFLQAVYQKGEKTTVLYTSNHGEGRNALWKTLIEPFEANKTEKIANTDNSFGFDIVDEICFFFVTFNRV
jgi:hypothetical protein